MGPKVTVCVPVYNGSQYLTECLDSVLAQSFQDLEVLVVDDGSKDDSWDIVSRYAGLDSRVRLARNSRNLGLVGNWNRCVQLARGEWVKFIFQDDVLEASCIERMLGISRDAIDLIAVRRRLVFSTDTPDAIRHIYNEYVLQNDLARHLPDCTEIAADEFAGIMIAVPDRNCIGEPSATMVRKRVFSRYGYFNANLVSMCDWEYFCRVAVNTGLCYIDEPLATFRVHNRSQSADLRAFSNFRANTLDPLLVQYAMLYLPAYSSLRSVAAKTYPRGYLKRQLAEAVKRAWWEAVTCPPQFGAKAQFLRTLVRYPRMINFPLGYLSGLAAKKVRALRFSKW